MSLCGFGLYTNVTTDNYSTEVPTTLLMHITISVFFFFSFFLIFLLIYESECVCLPG